MGELRSSKPHLPFLSKKHSYSKRPDNFYLVEVKKKTKLLFRLLPGWQAHYLNSPKSFCGCVCAHTCPSLCVSILLCTWWKFSPEGGSIHSLTEFRACSSYSGELLWSKAGPTEWNSLYCGFSATQLSWMGGSIIPYLLFILFSLRLTALSSVLSSLFHLAFPGGQA